MTYQRNETPEPLASDAAPTPSAVTDEHIDMLVVDHFGIDADADVAIDFARAVLALAAPAESGAPADLSAKLRALGDEAETKRQAEMNEFLERIHLGMRDAYRHAARLAATKSDAAQPSSTGCAHDWQAFYTGPRHTHDICAKCETKRPAQRVSAVCGLGILRSRPASSAPAVEAVKFSLTQTEGKEFLNAWMHGDWDVIRKEWPEAPESVFVEGFCCEKAEAQRVRICEDCWGTSQAFSEDMTLRAAHIDTLVQAWQTITQKAGISIIGGVKYLCLTEPMCMELGAGMESLGWVNTEEGANEVPKVS